MTKEFRLNSLIRDNIKVMKPYSSARDEYKDLNDDMVFLDANENPFKNGLNRYPDPQQQKVKSLLSKLKNIPTNQILLGNGSDEVLDLIYRVFCEPRLDEVIIIRPTYGMYNVFANINNVNIREINLDANFDINVNTVCNLKNKNTKILFLCSPNNPTGQSVDPKKMERLLNKFPGIVVIDEAYIDFSENESWLSRINEFPNLIITQTLSKAYGMAGIRLGICYASKKIIAVLNKIKPPYNISELTQLKAIERLSETTKISEEIHRIQQQRNWLISEFKTIPLIQKIFATDANFILVKVDNANKRYQELIDKGIVVRNRTNQPLCENCLRITVGSKIENIKLITALKSLK